MTDAIRAARHRLPIDNAGPRAQPGERLDNEGKRQVRSLPGRLSVRSTFVFTFRNFLPVATFKQHDSRQLGY
jgi:hypothetical protein